LAALLATLFAIASGDILRPLWAADIFAFVSGDTLSLAKIFACVCGDQLGGRQLRPRLWLISAAGLAA
jgi:hypothetical protein